MDESRQIIENEINRVHEQALYEVYRDKKPRRDELLEKDNSVKLHMKNLQVLVMEMYKVQNETSAAVMSRVFPIFQETTIFLETTLTLYLVV